MIYPGPLPVMRERPDRELDTVAGWRRAGELVTAR